LTYKFPCKTHKTFAIIPFKQKPVGIEAGPIPSVVEEEEKEEEEEERKLTDNVVAYSHS